MKTSLLRYALLLTCVQSVCFESKVQAGNSWTTAAAVVGAAAAVYGTVKLCNYVDNKAILDSVSNELSCTRLYCNQAFSVLEQMELTGATGFNVQLFNIVRDDSKTFNESLFKIYLTVSTNARNNTADNWVQQLTQLKNKGWSCADLVHDAMTYQRWLRTLYAYEQMVRGYNYLESAGVKTALALSAELCDCRVSAESFIMLNKARYAHAASLTQICPNLDWQLLTSAGFGVEVENLRVSMMQADQACRLIDTLYYLTTFVPERLDFIINSRKRCIYSYPLITQANKLAEVISLLTKLEQDVARRVVDQLNPVVLAVAQYQMNRIALAKQSKQIEYSSLVNSFEYCSQLQAFEHDQRVQELERQRREFERREREQEERLRLERVQNAAYYAQQAARQERERLKRQQAQQPSVHVVVVTDPRVEQQAQRDANAATERAQKAEAENKRLKEQETKRQEEQRAQQQAAEQDQRAREAAQQQQAAQARRALEPAIENFQARVARDEKEWQERENAEFLTANF